MTWRVVFAVGAAGCGVWLAAGQFSLAQDAPATQDTQVDQALLERSQPITVALGKRAIAYASQDGENAQLPEDNFPCLVCHANLEEELIVAKHLKRGITCVHCHGVSYAHRDDENNVTDPDIMYGRAEVKLLCELCHTPHKNPEKVQEFLTQWEGSVRPTGKAIPHQATCTDCHGTHAKKITDVPYFEPTEPAKEEAK